MNPTWQDIAVACTVLAAVAYAARKVWQRFLSNRSRCCDTCRQRPCESTTRQLISIDPPRTTADD